MSRKRQLARGREDAHAIVGLPIRRRQEKRGFRQVSPARERGHRRLVQLAGRVHDRQRVAAERYIGEDVDLRKGKRGHVDTLSRQLPTVVGTSVFSVSTSCFPSG